MKLLGLIVGLMFAITFRSLAAVPSGPPGGMTLNAVQKATGTNSIGDSAFSSVGTNGSLTGNFTANGAAFATTPTVNGSPVLTNATGGDTIWTNYTQTNAGLVISVVEETPLTNVFKLAMDSPFFSGTLFMLGTGSPDLASLIENYDLYGVGSAPFNGTAITNSNNVYSYGRSSFESAVIQNGTDIHGYGSHPFLNANMDGPSGVYAFGDSSLSGAFVTNSTYLFGFGSFPFQDAIIENVDRVTTFGDAGFVSSSLSDSSDLVGMGTRPFDSAIVTNSTFLFGFGHSTFESATITNSSALFALGDAPLSSANIIGGDSIFAYGVRALNFANLTNSSDIYAFGTDAGGAFPNKLAGENLTHIFILGSNGRATNSNDFVFGDSAYNYFFPGASATFAAVPTVNGVPLLTNATSGTTVSVNGTNVTTPNFTNTATVNYGISSSNVSANVVVPTGTATYLAGGSTANALVGVGIGAGLAMSGTNLTATATGSGVTEDVTTLGWSGTNITGFNCATNFQGYYLLATNNFHFGSSTFSNLPTKTQLRNFTLCIQMDSTGGRIGSFTNSVVGWSLGSTNAPFIETNANAVSYVYFHTDMTTNSTLVATFNMDVRR